MLACLALTREHESMPMISFAAIAKFLLDRIYRIIRIMKSPKTLAHCKNLVNPVNPV